MRTSYDGFVLPAERTFGGLKILVEIAVVLIIKAFVAVKPAAVVQVRTRAYETGVVCRFYFRDEFVVHSVKPLARRVEFVTAFPHNNARTVDYFFNLTDVFVAGKPAFVYINGFGGVDKPSRPDVHQTETVANFGKTPIVIAVA